MCIKTYKTVYLQNLMGQKDNYCLHIKYLYCPVKFTNTVTEKKNMNIKC